MLKTNILIRQVSVTTCNTSIKLWMVYSINYIIFNNIQETQHPFNMIKSQTNIQNWYKIVHKDASLTSSRLVISTSRRSSNRKKMRDASAEFNPKFAFDNWTMFRKELTNGRTGELADNTTDTVNIHVPYITCVLTLHYPICILNIVISRAKFHDDTKTTRNRKNGG
jgi:hypothetical protein